MTEKKYTEESEKTLSNVFNTENSKTESNVFLNISEIINKVNLLDKYKKILFYGKEDRLSKVDHGFKFNLNDTDEKTQKILHAAMGKVTESVEILEEVFNSIKEKRELDIVNIVEELGDNIWYDTIFYRELDIKPTDVRKKNYDKLQKYRYKSGFSKDSALNRDTEKEREGLEK